MFLNRNTNLQPAQWTCCGAPWSLRSLKTNQHGSRSWAQPTGGPTPHPKAVCPPWRQGAEWPSALQRGEVTSNLQPHNPDFPRMLIPKPTMQARVAAKEGHIGSVPYSSEHSPRADKWPKEGQIQTRLRYSSSVGHQCRYVWGGGW